MEDLSNTSNEDLISSLVRSVAFYIDEDSDDSDKIKHSHHIEFLKEELLRRLKVYDQVQKAAPSLKEMIKFIGGNNAKPE